MLDRLALGLAVYYLTCWCAVHCAQCIFDVKQGQQEVISLDLL